MLCYQNLWIGWNYVRRWWSYDCDLNFMWSFLNHVKQLTRLPIKDSELLNWWQNAIKCNPACRLLEYTEILIIEDYRDCIIIQSVIQYAIIHCIEAIYFRSICHELYWKISDGRQLRPTAFIFLIYFIFIIRHSYDLSYMST